MTVLNQNETQNIKNKKVVILGAGLAGLAAAWRLSQFAGHDIVILEKEAHTGGLAATLPFEGARFDLGSHRIHPGYPVESLEFIQNLLGNRLLTRPRDGTLIVNKWEIPYPLSPGSMLRAIGPADAARFAFSLAGAGLRNFFGRHLAEGENYESYLSRKVGRLAYKTFHAPYARKVYGINPENISSSAASTRVDSTAPFRFPGSGGRVKNFFHYPSDGFGAITDTLLNEARKRGARTVTGASVDRLTARNGAIREISYIASGAKHKIEADTIISTIPVNQLASSITPGAPENIANGAGALRWRGIRLLQLVIAKDKFLKGDTYYFPEEKYLFGRISEPKCFSPGMCPDDSSTTLNVEVILTPGDHLWNMDNKSFLALVVKDMEKVFTFRRSSIAKSRSIFLSDVYPVCDLRFRSNMEMVKGWLGSFGNLHSIGRGGMFFHGNADHSINLGLRTAENIASGGREGPTWGKEDTQSFKVRV
ncbi:hypothetical protein MNBD_NITROSPINAE02-1637 [hydrothermal vent metagenome]|uniref:Amine oxidase domain-containing protein n=1 Tax=hydrothermal vent metagenome TaxID=652676 RepID=A0A3B1CS23_9ZZZZ